MNIYIDCTSTYLSGINTGIQRVVRNILNNSILIAPELNIKIIPVIWNNKNFVELPGKLEYISEKEQLKSKKNKISKFKKFGKNIIKLFPGPFKKLLRYLFSYIGIYLFIYRTNKYPKVKTKKGDIFLFPDSSWDTCFWKYFKVFKNTDTKVGFIIYDIIPILNQNFIASGLEKSFTSWFEKIIRNSNFIFTISETTKNDVISYMKKQQITRNIPISSFLLGSSVDGKNKEGEIREDIKKIFADKKTYLFVSTIEPRKNHNYAIDAFEILWKNDKNIKLCLVGKIGWNCETLVKRIKNHPLYNKNLFLLNDVNDTELDHCYKNTKGVVFTSFIEGYGLPIVEGLSYNKPVFVSDIPIHHEVGKNFCYYANLEHPESLAELIKNNEEGKLPKIDMSKFKNITWEESTRELLKKIIALKL